MGLTKASRDIEQEGRDGGASKRLEQAAENASGIARK